MKHALINIFRMGYRNRARIGYWTFTGIVELMTVLITAVAVSIVIFGVGVTIYLLPQASPETAAELITVVAPIIGLVTATLYAHHRFNRRTTTPAHRTVSALPLSETQPVHDALRGIHLRYRRDYENWVAATIDDDEDIDSFAAAHFEDWKALNEQLPYDLVVEHEAAHATASLANGIPIAEIRTNPKSLSGHVSPAHTPSNRSLPDVAWAMMVVSSASIVFQIDTRKSRYGTDLDTALMLDCAADIVSGGIHPQGYVGPLSIDALIREASSRARTALKTHQALFHDFQDAIRTHHVLQAPQIRAIAQRHLPGHTRWQDLPDSNVNSPLLDGSSL